MTGSKRGGAADAGRRPPTIFRRPGARADRLPRGLVAVVALLVVLSALSNVPEKTSGGFGAVTELAVATVPPGPDDSRDGAPAPVSAPLLPPGVRAVSAGPQGTSWVNVTAGIVNGPPPRSNASLVWDALPADNLVLLFGGQNGTTILGDTWEFKDGVWHQLHPIPSPSARYGAGIAYDAAVDRVVLFGGEGTSGAAPDSWEFAGGSWTKLPFGPNPRVFPAMAYDPDISAVIMEGGMLSNNASAETWEFTSGVWTPLNTSTPMGPPARVAGSMVFDSASHQLLIFGGRDSRYTPATWFNDTWSFNYNSTDPSSSNWTLLPTPVAPSPRFDVALAYDSLDGLVVLFGGESPNGTALGDTWVWNGTSWSPDSLSVGSSTPAARIGGAAAPTATPGNGSEGGVPRSVFLLGGALAGGVAASDEWYFGNLSLSVLPPRITPVASDVGTSVSLSAKAFGGSDPAYTYAWVGLPLGCPVVDEPVLTCAPTTASTPPNNVSVRVSDGSGAAVQSAGVLWTVNATPAISALTALPSPLPILSALTVTLAVQGGTPPFSYAYLGLPPGCVSENLGTFRCTPTATGVFTVHATVTDVDAQSANASTTLVVDTGGTPATPVWEYVVEVALIGVTLLAIVVLVRAQLRGKASPPTPPTDVAGPEPAPAGTPSGDPPAWSEVSR